jgi:AcrR family transcriptional regulator
VRERDPARSREAILDAAERLFAERGFANTSLSDVGAAAGLSRGTPGYFFGSKQELYRAVLDRCFAQVRQAVRAGRERALASGQPSEVVLAGAVGEYFDFLLAHPNFVRLIEWEALSDGDVTQEGAHQIALAQEALTAFVQEVGLTAELASEGAQFLLSIIALCWFPLVHRSTIVRALGLDPEAPDFPARRRRHVVDLVLHGIRARCAEAGATLPLSPAAKP